MSFSDIHVYPHVLIDCLDCLRASSKDKTLTLTPGASPERAQSAWAVEAGVSESGRAVSSASPKTSSPKRARAAPRTKKAAKPTKLAPLAKTPTVRSGGGSFDEGGAAAAAAAAAAASEDHPLQARLKPLDDQAMMHLPENDDDSMDLSSLGDVTVGSLTIDEFDPAASHIQLFVHGEHLPHASFVILTQCR